MTVTVDMTKAKEIWRNKIRIARTEKFKELDTQYQRADEDGNAEAKASVVAAKKVLRDAPADPAIDAAITVEELKKVWPFE
jgi:hypothetical protein